MPVDPATQRDRRCTRDKLGDGERAGDPRLRPTQLRTHWRDEHREGVGQNTVGNRGRDSERHDECPAVVQVARPPARWLA